MRRALVCLGLSILGAACSGGGDAGSSSGAASSSSSGGSSSGGALPTDRAYISTRLRVAAAPESSGAQGAMHTMSLTLGGTSATSLESLKYSVKSIVICEDMETTGTGINPRSGCLTIYSVPEDPAYAYDPRDADFTHLADAARRSDAGFIDLMDAASRARMTTNTPLSAEHVHGYNYGAIYWNLPVKVKASIPMGDGSTFYTHDGPTVRTELGTDHYVSYPTVTPTPLMSGPAEEAVILHPNGGTWFKFQAPLMVTQRDVDDRVSYVLDLTFNPEGLVKGATFGGPPPSITEGGAQPRTIAVPMLDLTPVPHRASETVVKETYLANVRAGDDDFDVRLELYSVKEDPNRTIYGASARTLTNARSHGVVSDFQKIAFIDQTGGVLDFQAYDRSPALSGFTRGRAVGDTTTARIRCAHYGDPTGNTAGALFAGCGAEGNVPVTFRLDSVTEL